jgi:hypothetical protein
MTDTRNTAESATIVELLEALKNTVARMEDTQPPKAKKNDLEATWRVAIFYRDLHAARRAIARATGNV